jgi:hypothetical protein
MPCKEFLIIPVGNLGGYRSAVRLPTSTPILGGSGRLFRHHSQHLARSIGGQASSNHGCFTGSGQKRIISVRGQDNTRAGRSLNQSRQHGPSGRSGHDCLQPLLVGRLQQRCLPVLKPATGLNCGQRLDGWQSPRVKAPLRQRETVLKTSDHPRSVRLRLSTLGLHLQASNIQAPANRRLPPDRRSTSCPLS